MKPVFGYSITMFFLLQLFTCRAIAGSPFISGKEAKSMLGGRELGGHHSLATKLGSRSEIEDGWEDIYDYKKYLNLPPESKVMLQLDTALGNGWLLSKTERDQLVTQIVIGSGIGLAHVTSQLQNMASPRTLSFKGTGNTVR